MSEINEYDHLLFLASLDNLKLEKYSRKDIVCYPKLSDGSRILDIGCFGKSAILSPGENTSNFISDFYSNCLIDGINLESDLKYQSTNINIIIGDFFKYKPEYKYDYIINDISFNQMRFMLESHYILEEIPKILKPGGYFLQYTINESMDQNINIIDSEERKKFINDFWKTQSRLNYYEMYPILENKFGNLYDIVFCKEEYERNYISWFMLRLK